MNRTDIAARATSAARRTRHEQAARAARAEATDPTSANSAARAIAVAQATARHPGFTIESVEEMVARAEARVIPPQTTPAERGSAARDTIGAIIRSRITPFTR